MQSFNVYPLIGFMCWSSTWLQLGHLMALQIYKGDQKAIKSGWWDSMKPLRFKLSFLNTATFTNSYSMESFCYLLDISVRFMVLTNNILLLRLFNHLYYYLVTSGNSSFQPRSTPSAHINMVLASMDLRQNNQSSVYLFVALKFQYILRQFIINRLFKYNFTCMN